MHGKGIYTTVVKQLFPLETFEKLVEDRYDSFRRFVLEYEGHFNDAFEVWKREREGSGLAIHPLDSAMA